MLSSDRVTIERLNALLESKEFTRRPGFQVTGLREGECEIAVPYSPEYERPGGIVSGQLYMHAADVAFWLAIKTQLGMEDGSVTSAMTTAFLGSARKVGFECRARLLRLGQRLVYGEADCRAAGKLLTHHTLTYARPATSRAAETTSS
jgi:acyl-coenzyme A thioesterase PaaI-like protein